MSHPLLFQRVTILIFVAALETQSQPSGAAEDKDSRQLWQVVAEGIGRRFPPTRGPLVLDPWPAPLGEARAPMMTVAFSPEGDLAATGCGHPTSAGELAVWEVKTGRLRFVLPFSRGVRSVLFSHDGRHLATGHFDSVARWVDVATGEVVREFRRHAEAINGVALTPDDKYLATAGHDDLVMLWSVANGAVVRTFAGHTDDVLSVAVSPSGKLLASAGRDREIRLWSLETGMHLRTLTGHEALVEMVSFSPDSGRIASASWDGTVRLWDVDDGRQTHIFRGAAGRFTHAAFAPQGSSVVVAGFDGRITLWDYANDRTEMQFQAHDGAAYAISFSRLGRELMTCGWEGTAKCWTADGILLQTFDRRPNSDPSQGIVSAAWSPDEQHMALAHANGAVRLVRASTGAIITETTLSGESAVRVEFSDDNQTLLLGTDQGNVYRWPAARASGEVSKMLSHSAAVAGLEVSPDGKQFASCGGDGSIHIGSSETGRRLAMITAESPITCAAIGLGGLATGHADGKIRFWDMSSGRQTPGHLQLVARPSSIAFTTTGDVLAAAHGQNISLWSIQVEGGAAGGKARGALAGLGGDITAVTFVPRSSQLASSDRQGKIMLWESTSLVGRALPRQHSGAATALAIAPNSCAVVTAGQDGAAWLWKPAPTGDESQPLAVIPAHEKGARYVALTATSPRLVTDGYDNHVRIWNLASGEQERDLGVPSPASSCVLLPDGDRVAVGHWSERIQFVVLESGRQLDEFRGLPRGPYAISVSPDDQRMVAVFRELGAQLFDLTAFEADPLVSFAPDDLPYTYAAFAPDGKTFVTCTGDYQRMALPGKIRLHDARDGAVLRTFEGHTSEVKFAQFDADGKRLATTSGDKTVRLWDVAGGDQLANLPHPIGTFAAAFIPESDLLLTADYHGSVHLWDLRTGETVQRLQGHSDFVCRLSLSSDLTVLATGSRDGTAKLWRLSGSGNELRIVDAGLSTPKMRIHADGSAE
jgi:WD40 repeat protein